MTDDDALQDLCTKLEGLASGLIARWGLRLTPPPEENEDQVVVDVFNLPAEQELDFSLARRMPC